jgi:6,7-dimethyl-8-ribityllumazine synthase
MFPSNYAKSVSIVKAGWHAAIIDAFVRSCREHLEFADMPLVVSEYEVPGVVEIPLFCQKLIDHSNPDLVVVVGLIADHGVYRHDFVASSVMDAIMRLQMQTGTPIIYGILTPQDFMSEGREAFFMEHFVIKGREAASAAIKTLENERLLAEALVKMA